MAISDPEFIPFLLRAKKATYAAGDAASVSTAAGSSRPQSHDLAFTEGDYVYIDTYLGGFAFAGEEAVWKRQAPSQALAPLWAMNYYGSMTVDPIPDGFGDFLKLALRQVTPQAPYRGPAAFVEGRYTYACRWEGSVSRFRGEETIALDGQVVYQLVFHGGIIQ